MFSFFLNLLRLKVVASQKSLFKASVMHPVNQKDLNIEFKIPALGCKLSV